MNKYKIKVNNEAENREAQDLFEQLGFTWAGDYPENGDWYSHLYAEKSSCCHLPIYVWNGLGDKFQELTLPQLRDLVVLHRNDVKDATHRDKRDESIYLTSDKVIYYWQGEWCKSAINKSNDYENYIANSLTPITQPQDPALISGDVALANVHKCTVQYLHDDEPYGRWTTITDHLWSQYHLGMFLDPDTKFKFRFKPQTIKLELELPKPFEAKEGEEFFILAPLSVTGYTKVQGITTQVLLDEYVKLGAWRTEEEIKQVVAALRGGIKG